MNCGAGVSWTSAQGSDLGIPLPLECTARSAIDVSGRAANVDRNPKVVADGPLQLNLQRTNRTVSVDA